MNSVPKKPSLGNILTRQWRGDFSLATAYWVTGISVSLFTLVLERSIEAVSFGLTSRLAIFVLLITGMLLPALLTVWWLVGTWRSSTFHTQRGGDPTWALIARVVLSLAAIFYALSLVAKVNQTAPILADIVTPTGYLSEAEVTLSSDGEAISVEGMIGFGSAQAFKALLNASPKVNLVLLNSPGGRVVEARALGEVISAHGLRTHVDGICLSACTLAFLSGSERTIATSARIGFHSASIPRGTPTGVENQLNHFFSAALMAVGASETFIKKAINTSTDEMWLPTHRELQNAGVIHQTLDNTENIQAVQEQRDRIYEASIAALGKNRLVNAMTKYRPEAVRDMLHQMATISADPAGDMTQMVGIMQSAVTSIIQSAIREAPDELVLDYAKTQIAMIQYITNSAPATACISMTFPQHVKKAVNYRSLIPDELSKRETDATIAMFEASPIDGFEHAAGAAAIQYAFHQARQAGHKPIDEFKATDMRDKEPCRSWLGLMNMILAAPKQAEAASAFRLLLGGVRPN